MSEYAYIEGLGILKGISLDETAGSVTLVSSPYLSALARWRGRCFEPVGQRICNGKIEVLGNIV
jgi:hypothetical protein